MSARVAAVAEVRVLVLAASLPSMRAIELAIGRSAAVRGCLGARAGMRALLTWEPTVLVVEHEPPALDATEVLRSLFSSDRFVPDVLLVSSRTAASSLDTLASRHPNTRAIGAPGTESSLAPAIHEAHRVSRRRRDETAERRRSGTRRKV